MKYPRLIFSAIMLISALATVNAQFEMGIMGGVATYSGDLSKQNTWFSTGDWNAGFGLFGRYTFHPLVAARVGFTYGTLSASDAKATDGRRVQRNLSFQSSLYELSAIAEFNILGYQPYNLVRPWSPYIFVGVAGYVYNPQAELDGVIYDLQPLGTEGQGLPGYENQYTLTQFAIPMGGGIKFAINDQWNLGLEFGGRKIFTDYLDDVSGLYAGDEVLLSSRGEIAAALSNRTGETRVGGEVRGSGTTAVNDWYFTGMLMISYNFTDNGLVGSRTRRRGGKRGCPTAF